MKRFTERGAPGAYFRVDPARCDTRGRRRTDRAPAGSREVMRRAAVPRGDDRADAAAPAAGGGRALNPEALATAGTYVEKYGAQSTA
ncbi:hypothetical protein GCM10023238_18610 [Streptomyces heliomycini]